MGMKFSPLFPYLYSYFSFQISLLYSAIVLSDEKNPAFANIYIFGEKSEAVIDHYAKADYVSKEYYDNSPVIKEAVDFIVSKETAK